MTAVDPAEVEALVDEGTLIADLIDLAENLERIEGGFRLKLSDDGRHHIDLLLMLFNWRVVTTPVDCPQTIDRGWCYFGTGPVSFRKAMLAALVWDGADDSEPVGYDKKVGSS